MQLTCGNPRCQHEFCWLCLHDWTRATHDASFCTGRAEASYSEVLPSVERQIRSNWAQQAHDTRPAEDTYAEEVLQRFRVALTTRLESDAELLSAEDADVPLRWRRLLEFYDHSEKRIRATTQVVFAGVFDRHRAQQELIQLLSRVRDRWWLRLSPEDVDAHNESFMDPQAPLELPCPVRRRMHAERASICLEEHFGSQLVKYERNMVQARHSDEQSAGLWRIEMANAHAQAAAEQEAAVARCRFLAAAALDNARVHAENRCERLEEGFIRERDRAAVAELVLADRGAQLREEQAMVSEFQDTALGMQARVDEFVEQYAESTKRVIDWECSDVKKHERDLVENAEALAMSSGPHGQTSAPAHEFSSASMSNEVCYKSCSLHKGIYSALQRDHCVCFDSHSGSPADSALCNVNCPGNSCQFCGGDNWYTLHLMYLWVTPVEVICSGMTEPVGNNMPTYTTVCFDYFNENVLCISTCPSGQHLVSHEPVCDLLS